MRHPIQLVNIYKSEGGLQVRIIRSSGGVKREWNKNFSFAKNRGKGTATKLAQSLRDKIVKANPKREPGGKHGDGHMIACDDSRIRIIKRTPKRTKVEFTTGVSRFITDAKKRGITEKAARKTLGSLLAGIYK